MSRNIEKRLERLEHRLSQAQWRPLRVCYAGTEPPDDPHGLVVVIHRVGCDTPGHLGLCEVSAPEHEGY